MSSLKDIMKIKEEELDLVVFTQKEREAGINTVYDPTLDKEIFQVFVHYNFPLREEKSWEFDSFREARNFAASQFKDWELLHWNHGVNRPCGKGDDCGKGACSTKNPDGSEGGCGTGGCTSCGATKEFDEMLKGA
ncbi:MAG: hypothetical protein R3A80_03090 [Bdellovibrionota bacterium]